MGRIIGIVVSCIVVILLLVFLLRGCGIEINKKDNDKPPTTTTTVQSSATTDKATETTPATTPATTSETDAAEETTPEATASTDNTETIVNPEPVFFSADSPWNTRVDGLEVDPKSATMMRLAKERTGVIERADNLPPRTQRRVINDGLYINTRAWTTPIVQGGANTTMICRQILCGDNKDVDTLPVPADIDPDPRYDGWFTIITPDGNTAYDLWRGRREDANTISYQFMRKWDLNGKGFNKPQTVSARGSGLPLFAGVIRPREIQAGRINHALAISVPGPAQRNFVQPASVTDGNGRLNSLPEGARIRLKAGVTFTPAIDPRTGKKRKYTRAQRRVADALVAALRQYGAIVVDRAAVPTLYGQRDVTSTILNGNELEGINLDDFEVIKLGTVYQDPPLSTTTQSGPQVQTSEVGTDK